MSTLPVNLLEAMQLELSDGAMTMTVTFTGSSRTSGQILGVRMVMEESKPESLDLILGLCLACLTF